MSTSQQAQDTELPAKLSPLCINCRHYTPIESDRFGDRCAAPAHGVDLIYGRPRLPPCELQRSSPSKTACGQSGRLFVAKTSASEATSEAKHRTDAEIVERTETAARYLAHWRWGAMPEHEGQTTRNSGNAKLNAAWLAACYLQEIMTDSDAVNAAQVVDDVANPEGGAA